MIAIPLLIAAMDRNGVSRINYTAYIERGAEFEVTEQLIMQIDAQIRSHFGDPSLKTIAFIT